jgi:hypothetical protein
LIKLLKLGSAETIALFAATGIKPKGVEIVRVCGEAILVQVWIHSWDNRQPSLRIDRELTDIKIRAL